LPVAQVLRQAALQGYRLVHLEPWQAPQPVLLLQW
jgi:hypothetical protein